MGEKTLEQIIMVMTDQHIPHLDERMERITMRVAEDYRRNITDFVFLGDGVDNPVMSEFPARPQDKTLLQEEVDAYVQHLNYYHAIAPKANLHIFQGNHDGSRLERTKSINRSLSSLRALEFKKLLKESAEEQGLALPFQYHETAKIKGVNFTHGDPRIDPYIKGGAAGVRRTAEVYPESGNIVMGHRHQVVTYPRLKGDAACYVVGAMFDIDQIAKQYKSFHGYENGFMLIRLQDNGEYQFDNLKVTKAPLKYGGKVYK